MFFGSVTMQHASRNCTTIENAWYLHMNMDRSLTLNRSFLYSFRITDNQVHLNDMFFGSVTMQHETRKCATVENAWYLQINLEYFHIMSINIFTSLVAAILEGPFYSTTAIISDVEHFFSALRPGVHGQNVLPIVGSFYSSDPGARSLRS